MSLSVLHRSPPPARLRYGPEPQHFGDLRLPGSPGPHPALLIIHGGYWRARYDLDYLGPACAALAIAGIATWNIEYRRVGDPGGGWPNTFLDVAAGARHLFTMATQYGIDPAHVAVAGHSAGGHLALWLAGLDRVPTTSPIRSNPLPLRGVASLAGVTDLHAAWHRGLSDHAVGELLGGGPDTVPDRYDAASPARLLPLGVRQILIHGERDDAVPVALSTDYRDAAHAAGDAVRAQIFPAADHFDIVDPASVAWPAVLEAIRALFATAERAHATTR